MGESINTTRSRAILVIAYGSFFLLLCFLAFVSDFSDIVKNPLELLFIIFLQTAVYAAMVAGGFGIMANKPWVNISISLILGLLILRIIVHLGLIMIANLEFKSSIMEELMATLYTKRIGVKFILTFFDFCVLFLLKSCSKPS